MSDRVLRVGALARVEGEASLLIKVRDGRVSDVKLSVFEPPRFFEALLRGKGFMEVPDVVSRICGICPVAYQMSSVHAFESLFEASVDPQVRALRRLFYCGEWIESHALHIFLLHAPDFLGYADGLAMAKDHRTRVETGLRLKKAGNDLVAFLGGREIHPVSARVGGFYKAPPLRAVRALEPELVWAAQAAEDTLGWVMGFDFPAFEPDYEFVALRHPQEYPMNEGRVVSSSGLDMAAADFLGSFREVQVPHSNALQAVGPGGGRYLVGPLARFNLNFDRLPPRVKQACRRLKLEPPVNNPFKSIAVRAAEVWFACEEALRVVRAYSEPDKPYAEPRPRAGEGHAATEAPRGLLYHRYRVDAQGRVLEARIVPPTSQNQGRIEEDLRLLVPSLLALPKGEFSWRCEQAVRNYDPCISCATHFLRVTLDEGHEA